MKYIKILRIQQWSKNLIIFLPITLLQEFETLFNIEIYLIFFSFSLLVSSTYIFNDIRDQDQDKLHPKKKIRPIASGEMSKTVAKNYGSVLILLSFLSAYYIQDILAIYFLFYLGLTTIYSLSFKYLKYLDFLTISILFYIRIIVGGINLNLKLTNYFIIFIISTLTVIAIGKKYSILKNPEIKENVRIKVHLVNSYSESELRLIYIFFSTVSVLTYIVWLNANFSLSFLYFLISILGLFSLYLFLNTFYKSSKSYQTENFVEWMLIPKNLINILIITVSSLLIIY